MSLREIVVDGTLKPDGTLELNHKPDLLPGRVQVVLRQEVELASPQEDWWQCLQRLRAEREANGYPFMNEREANAHIDWLREEDRFDDILRQTDEVRKREAERE